MTNKEKILVYFEDYSCEYREIDIKYVKDTESILKYFGPNIDDNLDENNEFVIYELVPFAKVKRNIEFNLETKDE